MPRLPFLLLLPALALAGSPGLRYERPAASWERERLPIGNGRLGAMIDGGVAADRLQFNEESLWTGDANPSGGYEYGADKPGTFGCYRDFGEVTVTLATTDRPVLTRAFPVAPWAKGAGVARESAGGDFAHAHDGDPRTKWCVERAGNAVVWQVELPEAAPVRGYALTSANDVPDRDPSDWVLEGSSDGANWVVLDRQSKLAPFPERLQRRVFPLAASGAAYRLYRLTFQPRNPTHFQVAEIELLGLDLRPAGVSVPAGYSRRLDLVDGVHSVEVPGQSSREAFASKPAEVVAARYVGVRPLAGKVELRLSNGDGAALPSGDTLRAGGSFSNGLSFAAGVRVVLPRGGEVRPEGGHLRFSGAPEVLVLLAARTSYVMDPSKGFKGPDPRPRVEADLEAAARTPFARLREAHVADHRSLMGRVSVDWGATPAATAALPTDARLAAYAKGGADPDLEETLFQYGRYLLVGSSRADDLPANLQGIWNSSNNPPWASDYHNNINVQMNYWLAGPANLAECQLALVDWIISQVPGCREATRADRGRFGDTVRGWTVRTSQNIWGGNGWEWNLPGNAWLVQHAWEQHAFTQDKVFLRDKAYPLLKEVSEFWVDHLKALPDGTLVVPMGWSPEHGPREDGVAHDQQLVWDLFENTIEASEALGVDKPFRDELRAKQARLLGPQVGRWGQLMEWKVDRDDPKDQHRHTSHLLALHPGRQVTRERTPELAKAAAISLAARGSSGDSRRSWTWPWRCAMWARLGEAGRCADMIRGLLTHNTLPNLFSNHPPFQLDGNFGITAGICEMLLQSHAGEIVLLPALPKAWADGNASGLRARGAVEVVEMGWKDGRLSRAVLRADADRTVRVRVNGEVREVALRAGVPTELR